ncbi:MAG TPA: ATP-dependent dethiobiotin synthetase BioD, partial [Terriglobia bacterium]|nr:ATP-dependent dethiobiotin synthetase BioD [Terriglobia bacterium]
MFRGLFITGTDTGIGKTAVAAAVMIRYRRLQGLRYWKPIQTGIETDDDTETVRKLAGCGNTEVHPAGIRLAGAVAPYLAAERSGTRITVEEVIRLAAGEPEHVRWVAEGAGGVLVPINDSESMLDL